MLQHFVKILLITGVFVSVGYLFINISKKSSISKNHNKGSILKSTKQKEESIKKIETSLKNSEKIAQSKLSKDYKSNIPLADTVSRKIIKPFGIFITPSTSPVQPERFNGYHTGVDLEISIKEQESDVLVRALCSGKVVKKGFVNGYGGVVVQRCLINEESVTVLYGHLKTSSIKKNGNILREGEEIGLLGTSKSKETDYERKHLHLSIHKGEGVNLLGYVQDEEELLNWVNPCQIVNCATE